MYSTFKAVLISLISGWILLVGPAGCQDGGSTGVVIKPDGEKPVQTNASVTGSVTYRERIALTPDATVHVQLRDTSYQDAPSMLIAEQVIHNPGQVPIKFKIDYNRDDLEPRNTYSVSARITGPDGRLMFINDTAYDVITGGNPSNVDMLLVMVDAPALRGSPRGGRWRPSAAARTGEPAHGDVPSVHHRGMLAAGQRRVRGGVAHRSRSR